jgi:hypothetical protein
LEGNKVSSMYYYLWHKICCGFLVDWNIIMKENEGKFPIKLHLNGAQLNSLCSKLQQAEAKAAAAQEKERAVNERLTQTLSRMAVMEAQVCGTAEIKV